MISIKTFQLITHKLLYLTLLEIGRNYVDLYLSDDQYFF